MGEKKRERGGGREGERERRGILGIKVQKN